MKQKRGKLTLRKEDIVNLSNLNQKNVVGGTATGPPRHTGIRVVPCDTLQECITIDPCSGDGDGGGGEPDTKEVSPQG